MQAYHSNGAKGVVKMKIPNLYSTENVPVEEKILYVKFFKVQFSWFIAERTANLCFGYVQNLAMPEFSEWGYFDMQELQANNAEKDICFEPVKFKELFNDKNTKHKRSVKSFIYFLLGAPNILSPR